MLPQSLIVATDILDILQANVFVHLLTLFHSSVQTIPFRSTDAALQIPLISGQPIKTEVCTPGTGVGSPHVVMPLLI